MLFAFPLESNKDVTRVRKISTFARAMRLFSTVTGRRDYTDPGEKFENVTMMLFEPYGGKRKRQPRFQLFDAKTGQEITEAAYFQTVRQLYNERNPHALVGEANLDDD
jgi:hypothetical protein